MKACQYLSLCLFVAVMLLTSSGDAQQTPSVSALTKRIELLETIIIEMDERISTLEKALAEKQADKGAPKAITFDQLDGKATITASDGEFLGQISSNVFAAKSIMNDVGLHGSEVAAKSIFNNVGKYGGEISTQSPWNELAANPPKVFLGDRFIGYLTTNELKSPRINPHALVAYLKSKK